MKTIIGTSVSAFLNGLPNMNNILACYSGITRVYLYSGPHRFYRAAGKTAKGDLARAYGGEWWADESVLLEIARKLESAQHWMTNSERERAWPAQYRALTALSRDWNDMSEMFMLELPVGEKIEGLAGLAKEQPEFSVYDPMKRHDPNRVFVGNAEQIFFKVKNPLWIHKVNLW
jgi:hypothetical protein